LFEASKLGVKLSGHEEAGPLIGKHEIDHAASRLPNGNFWKT
jgi:hypothetical protein